MAPPDHPVSSIRDPLAPGGKFLREGERATFVKAVTFGPFPAGAFPDEGRSQLERIRGELDANALRLYEIPSLEFLHECARVGLRVFITIPWAQHIDFLSRRNLLAEADQLLLETVLRFRGHPAVAGYYVANEIESTLVRWMGPRRVVEQIERLIDLGRANDPGALFAYANYPSTEYLLPRNQDFVAFNIYLETREALAAYLPRLQNLAGDKPLLISEFGVDSRSHGEEAQAEMLAWHLEEVRAAGAAGTTLFAWSDLWRRGGRSVEGWDFGLTRRDGGAKPALPRVREAWESAGTPGEALPLERTPPVSVIVCTHCGAATLAACLNSLVRLNYPDFEIIVVNDSADARVAEIVSEYEGVVHLPVEHGGLAAARNAGAELARGEILAYTDDDCEADPDWLRWIVHQFLADPSLGCAGGPNIPPPPEDARQALVAAAPGSPVHVLLSDTRAEHLPGCNLAVRREVFDQVGGFNPVFQSAGDDVDFCWRVLDAGRGLGFHAAAFVWHRRRPTPRAYLRQQSGYGRAEALLIPLHAERFRHLGGAEWRGRVYTPHAPAGQVIYHGRYGYEPFQFVYPTAESGLTELLLHVLWWTGALGLAAAGLAYPPLWIVAALMALASLRIAWIKAGHAVLDRAHESALLRLRLVGLVLAQGAVRSGARLRHGWRFIDWPGSLASCARLVAGTLAGGWWKFGGETRFWSDRGAGRDELLACILESRPGAEPDPAGKTDLILKRGFLWNWAVLTVTEYHEDEGRFTRLRLLARPQHPARILAALLVVLAVLWLGVSTAAAAGFFLALALAAIIGQCRVRGRLRSFRKDAEAAGLKPV